MAAHKDMMRGAYDAAATRYARYIEPSFMPIAEYLLSLAAPRADERHLDLATGTGLLLARADRRAEVDGTGARQPAPRIGLDLSAAMLRHARRSSPTTRCVQGDLESLPVRTSSIDVATLGLALHHLPAPRAALAEARRVVRTGGRLAVAAWSSALGELWRAFDTWMEQVGQDEMPTVQRTETALDTPELLRAALSEAGFGTVTVTAARPPLTFPDFDAFWAWRTSFPATHRVVGALTAEQRDRLRARCFSTLAPVVHAGPVRADLEVMFALAR